MCTKQWLQLLLSSSAALGGAHMPAIQTRQTKPAGVGRYQQHFTLKGHYRAYSNIGRPFLFSDMLPKMSYRPIFANKAKY